MPQVERPRGTRDFAPEEMAKRRWLEGSFRGTAHRYGYREVQTPTFEHAELFIAKSGENVLNETYEFRDKSDRHLMLRPELTAPTMRMYLDAFTHAPKPLKWYYHGPCFRYEQPQEGRYREFFQFGVELIGPSGPEADAEVVAVANAMMRDAGLERFDLHVGHIGVLRVLADGVPQEHRATMFRLVDKDSDELEDKLAEWGVDAKLAGAIAFVARHERKLVLGDEEGAPRAVEEYFQEALDAVKPALDDERYRSVESNVAHVQETLGFLGAMGVTVVRVDLGVARGLDYYTGLVFEFHAQDLGAQSQIGGGGAYSLTDVLGGQPTPTAGFGLGFDRILLALERAGKIPAEAAYALDAYVAPIGDAARVAAFEIAARLRAEGLRVDVDLMRRKPGKNFDHANTISAPRVIVLGAKELEQGVASVKDMATGEQTQVPLTELANALRA